MSNRAGRGFARILVVAFAASGTAGAVSFAGQPWWVLAPAVAVITVLLLWLWPSTGGGDEAAAGAGAAPALPMRQWESQVEDARQEGERAIMGLVNSFTAMNGKLEEAAHNAERTSGDVFQANADALRAAKQDLRPLIDSLRQSVVARKKAIEEVRQLHAVTKELAGMADQVRQVARQTELLAVNAAIQASRAGEAGRGFNVVAAEIRRLAAFSSDTGRDISERIRRVGTAMKSLDAYADQADVDDERLVQSSERLITEILTPLQNLVADLLASAAGMLSTNASVRDEINQMTAGLQFQDRVSQILARVRSEMERMERGEAADPAPAPASASPVRASGQAEAVEFF